MPKISIIIPCYNYGQYIESAIDSVLASTFNDYEIIIINDGSTESQTIQILDHLKKPKTKIISQANQKVSIARNNGIKISQGKYFLPLDADDTIEPTFLEKAYWILETKPNLGYVYSHVQLFGNENWIWETLEYNYYKLLFENHISYCSLVRKKAWENIGGYNPNMIYGYEDWDFFINLGKHGWYGQLIPETLFNYRKHGSGLYKIASEKKELLIKQIKKNHSEIYSEKALKELRNNWHINKNWHINSKMFVFGRKIVNSLFFPSRMKHALKRIYFKRKNSILHKIKSKKPSLDFNLISEYQCINNEKLGVLYIVSRLTCGGAESFLYGLINNLDRAKYQPIIVTTIKDQNVWQSKFKQITPLIFHFFNLFNEVEFPYFISKLIKLYNIKIIHISDSQLAYESIKQIKKLQPEVMSIATVHNHIPECYLSITAYHDSGIDIYVAVNSLIKDILIKKLKIQPQKVELIYNGVDIMRFSADLYNKTECLKIFSLPQNKKIIGYIGRFAQEKNPIGFLKIVEFFKNNNGVLFVMTGDGELFKKVQDKSKRSGLKHKIIFTGQVERMPELFCCLDIIVNTSEIEGFPISILEAMSMGVPIVASNVGGIKELVNQCQNGYLIDDFNYKDFADKIKIILNSDNIKNQIAQNNRQKVSQNFIAVRMTEQYLKLYDEWNFIRS